MTPLPKIYVSPVVGPRWFCVVRDGTSTSGGYAGAGTWQMPDDTRHESYRIAYGEATPSWREASPDEVALALWSVMIEEHWVDD